MTGSRPKFDGAVRTARRTPARCSTGAAWRACKALGYRKIITYTLPEEGGASLRATGFTLVGEAGGGRWNRPGRPAADTHPIGKKLRWELKC
jgi:hypothetical protein